MDNKEDLLKCAMGEHAYTPLFLNHYSWEACKYCLKLRINDELVGNLWEEKYVLVHFRNPVVIFSHRNQCYYIGKIVQRNRTEKIRWDQHIGDPDPSWKKL